MKTGVVLIGTTTLLTEHGIPTLTVNSDGVSSIINISSPAGQAAGIVFSEAGDSNWQIWERGGSVNQLSFFQREGAGATEVMTMLQGGFVGIGATTPAVGLDIVQTGTANDVLTVEDSSGRCNAQPTTLALTWSCSSDIRLKENIVLTDFSALTYLNNIDLFDYTVKKTGERVGPGPVAQDMQIKYPELVSVGSDGYLAVTPPDTWKLVKAIQELDAKNTNLESRIKILEDKLLVK